MPKFKAGDSVWWKVDDVLRDGKILSFEDGFYAIKTGNAVILCGEIPKLARSGTKKLVAFRGRGREAIYQDKALVF
jgi:hypothetical protein